MKHKNCKFAYTSQFRQDLYRVYKESLKEHIAHGTVLFAQVVQDAIAKPSKRFWASEEQVYSAIRKIEKGGLNANILPTKKEMYLEIYSRVIAMKRDRPNMRLRDIVLKVCEQPAPKFYITPRSARTIIFDILKCKREQQHIM